MMCVCWMLGLCWVGVVWPLPSPRPHPRPLSRCCRVFWGRGGIVVDGGVGWCLGALGPPLSFGHFPRERGKP